jgi:hypothetical protein
MADLMDSIEALLDTLRRVTEARGGVFKRSTYVATLQFGTHTLRFSVGSAHPKFPPGYLRADPIAKGRLMKGNREVVARFVLFIGKEWLIGSPGRNLQPLTDDLLSASLDAALAESPGPGKG